MYCRIKFLLSPNSRQTLFNLYATNFIADFFMFIFFPSHDDFFRSWIIAVASLIYIFISKTKENSFFNTSGAKKNKCNCLETSRTESSLSCNGCHYASSYWTLRSGEILAFCAWVLSLPTMQQKIEQSYVIKFYVKLNKSLGVTVDMLKKHVGGAEDFHKNSCTRSSKMAEIPS